MIPTMTGWSVERLPQGLVMTHPEGAQVGTIRYRERARPLLRLGALVRQILSRTPLWRTDKLGEPEHLQTFDGEHAALITVVGTQDGLATQQDLGFVFADDFVSSVGSLCHVEALRPSFTAVVRELTRRDAHGLGHRRRRFEYDPPGGWQPVPRTRLAVEWLAPGHPRDPTTLTVHAAVPRHEGPSEGAGSFDRLVASLLAQGHQVHARRARGLDVPTFDGALEELTTTRQDETRERRIAVLRDPHYVYPFELVGADLAPHHAVLERLLRSVARIPAASRVEAVVEMVSHWLE